MITTDRPIDLVKLNDLTKARLALAIEYLVAGGGDPLITKKTLSAVAKKTQINQSTLSRWRSQQTPSISSAYLARFSETCLGLTLEQFLSWLESSNSCDRDTVFKSLDRAKRDAAPRPTNPVTAQMVGHILGLLHCLPEEAQIVITQKFLEHRGVLELGTNKVSNLTMSLSLKVRVRLATLMIKSAAQDGNLAHNQFKNFIGTSYIFSPIKDNNPWFEDQYFDVIISELDAVAQSCYRCRFFSDEQLIFHQPLQKYSSWAELNADLTADNQGSIY